MIFDVDRFKAAITTIVREIVAEMVGLPGVYEYRVAKAEGGKLTARPAEKGIGLPDLVGVPMRGSITGGQGEVKLASGASVLVAFINHDRGRPVLVLGDDATDPVETGIVATSKATVDAPSVVINGGAQGAARMGDPILAGGIFAGSITNGSTTTKIG